MAHIVGPLPRVTMDVSDQLRRALRAMPLRPRVLELARWGVWSELLAMGEEATREETDDSRASKMEKWIAVARFMNGYCGLAHEFLVLEFFHAEHKAWCNAINEQSPDVVIRMGFEEQYGILVGGHPCAEDWPRLMVGRVRERCEMMANSLASDFGVSS